MAKKSTKKAVAKRKVGMNVVWDILTFVLGGLLLGFVALPHIKAEVSSSILGGVSSSVTSSGYSLISFKEGADIGVAVVLLLLVIFACLLIVSSLIQMLCDFNVIKNATLSKVTKWLTLACAFAVAVLSIVNIITVSAACSNGGGEFLSAGSYAMWGTLIVNAVLGVASMVTSVLATRK